MGDDKRIEWRLRERTTGDWGIGAGGGRLALDSREAVRAAWRRSWDPARFIIVKVTITTRRKPSRRARLEAEIVARGVVEVDVTPGECIARLWAGWRESEDAIPPGFRRRWSR